MWRSPIFWKRFLTYSLIWLLAIVVVEPLMVSQFQKLFLKQMEEQLQGRAAMLRQLVQGKTASEVQKLQDQLTTPDDASAMRMTLIAGDGTVLVDSEANPRVQAVDNHASRPEVRAAREAGIGIVRQRHSDTVHREMMYLALRTDDEQGAVAYARVALPLDRIEAQLGGLRLLVWTEGAVVAAVGILLIFVMTRKMTRTLDSLSVAAERIAAGDYGHKVLASGGSEVGQLARNFNRMSDRLADQFARIEEDREQLRTILSGMVEGVVALDSEQRILFVNERAAHLLDFHSKAAVGRKLWEVVRQRALQDVVGRALTGRVPCQEELRWNGAARSITVHAARLPGAPPRGAVLVLHDTSELRRLERLRQEFVANVSHELKTPLSVITACVETLIDAADQDPAHREQFLGQIADQSHRLHALILDLLSIARIETHAEVFEFQNVPLEPVVLACLERQRARAEAKRQTLEAIRPDNALEVWADEEAVSQILDNLVDNALKYTAEGGLIRVRWYAADKYVCLEVADNGIGIPEQDLPRIFERFYRVDKARSRELGGTGLGLSIVKHLVQAMRGSVRATSRAGQGTTFIVRLPRQPGA